MSQIDGFSVLFVVVILDLRAPARLSDGSLVERHCGKYFKSKPDAEAYAREMLLSDEGTHFYISSLVFHPMESVGHLGFVQSFGFPGDSKSKTQTLLF